MRILLAQNSLYYPSHGGGDISNRLLMEALAARGHQCRAVARIPVFGAAGQERYAASLADRGVQTDSSGRGIVRFVRGGVEVCVVANTGMRANFEREASGFAPEAILASTDDPAQLLLEPALASPARVVYLARATLALPFGPDCAFPSEAKAARIRAADAIVGVSEYVAGYIRGHGGVDAVHVPISLMEPRAWPDLGRFDNKFVVMVNPCAVKGIGVFLALADALPRVAFAAVAGWGTNAADREALASRPNIQLLDPVDDICGLLANARVLLAPSLWAEARSRVVVEAMLAGVPVMAANVGGLPEAKLGVPYLLPVNPITRYRPRLDEQMVPAAETPPQDAGPWREALERLLSDRDHYAWISRASRAAALQYLSRLSVEPFEDLLRSTVAKPGRARVAVAAPGAGAFDGLSAEKRRLLAVRLRARAPSSSWFAGIQAGQGMRLFAFPHAGGGASAFSSWRIANPAVSVCPVRLPGRESRSTEAPFERMAPLAAALRSAIEPYLDAPYAFFGHSMGAAVAFEVARRLREARLPLPRILIASGARAPQFRLGHRPPPDPDEAAFLAELRSLEGIPAEALDDPVLLYAILPALRADAALYRRYVYTACDPFEFPIRAYGGLEDANVGGEHLEAWSRRTSSTFAARTFPGGHFYLQAHRDEVLAALAEDLATVC